MADLVGAAVRHLNWMSWNAALAFVPVLLSRALFRDERPHNAGWWAGVVAFVLFLPNAPYVLTDVIHLIADVRATESQSVIALAVIPTYALFFTMGVGAYVVAMRDLSNCLRRHGVDRAHRLSIRLGIHLLCAFGIQLGRVHRLNSWDTVVHPMRLVTASLETIAAPGRILVTFAVITIVFNAMKVITLGMRAWLDEARAGGLAGA